MTETSAIFLASLQLIIHAIAIYFSYVIYRYNRLTKAWLAVTAALVIMEIRRITVLLILLNVFPKLSGYIDFFDKYVLPFTISLFFFIGLWGMMKNFETFETVEKKTETKAINFSRKRRQ